MTREYRNTVLRMSIHLRGSVSQVQALLKKLRACRSSLITNNKKYIEVWVWCSNVSSLLTLIEECLSLGFIPIAFGLLDGKLVLVEKLRLDPELLQQLALSSISLQGEIVVEYFEVPNLFKYVTKIPGVKRIKIYYRKRRAVLHVHKPVNTKVFFDNLLRVIKPRRIPP